MGHKNKNLKIRLDTSFVLSQSSLIPGEMSVNMIMFGERYKVRPGLVTAECWGPPPYTDTEGGYGDVMLRCYRGFVSLFIKQNA